MRSRIAVELDARRIRIALLGVVAFFISTSLVAQLLFNTETWVFSEGLQDRVLNVDAEDNMPTWFSSSMVFVIAILSFARSQRETGRARRVWQLLAFTAAVVAFDEVTTYHERVGARIRDQFDTEGLLHHVWVVPAAIAFGLVGLYCLGTVRRIAAPHRNRIVLGASLMAAGAMGMEVLAGAFSDDQDSVPYTLCVHAEEGLEMLGAVILLTALIEYAGRPAARRDEDVTEAAIERSDLESSGAGPSV